MMIMEANSGQDASALIKHLKEHVRRRALAADILIEEDGHMVIFQVPYPYRDALLTYQTTPGYRHLVEGMNQFLLGDPVVKVFKIAHREVGAEVIA